MNNMEQMFPNVEYHGTVLSAAKDADALLVLTEWNEFRNLDLIGLKERMRQHCILDTRNILDTKLLASLGFKYLTVGRPMV